jgi:3-oxoacyl-[acyl-carrier protein] reductase
LKLKDKIAIVTGGSAGIGEAIAHTYAAEGASVVIASRNAEKGQKVSDAINDTCNQRNRALFVKTDVSIKNEVVSMVEKTVELYKKVDILVNNAGILLQSYIVDTKEEDWDRVIDVNLKGCFLCSQAVAKKMIEQNKGGKIINISSVNAQLSESMAASYTASKGGMEAFSRTLATELAPFKINVNCIEPGATETDMLKEEGFDRKAFYKRIPWGEIATPDMIASAAVFLASDDSYYMTGSVIVVDGGFVMDFALPET